jgi:hypothetical protein
LIAASTLAGAAVAQPAQPDNSGPRCNAAGASFVLGEYYSDRLARRARRSADARVVRKVEPGRAYTMDFRVDRLNLDVDRRGRVRAVRCG